MKSTAIVLGLVFIISTRLLAQSNLNLGIAYYGENVTSPGIMVEFEYEKFYSKDLSLPLRADVAFFSTPEFNALTLDIHKGFRKYFDSGLYLEQSIGIGLISSFYTIESIWYIDNFGSVVRYRDGANLGFMPSVSIGIGYNLTPNNEKQNLIWVRPKIYWNFGVRGLNLPYAALQVGYTYNFKTKK